MDEKIVKDSQCLAKDLVNDCISRYGVSAWLDNMGYSKLADVVMDKDRFPSAQPEIAERTTETAQNVSDGDLISRKAAIERIDEALSRVIKGPCGEKILARVPSAQPEIIRCRDCKWHRFDKDNIPYCYNIDYGYGWKDDDFCSRAERREDNK